MGPSPDFELSVARRRGARARFAFELGRLSWALQFHGQHRSPGDTPSNRCYVLARSGAAQLPMRFPIEFLGSISAREEPLSLCFYWWAHKGSNLGPAD